MANRRTRRGPAVVVSILAIAAAGGLSFYGARAAADLIESHTEAQVSDALRSGGFDWAEVTTEGLQVRLGGTAPDEIQRFRAKSRAETVVEADRVVDEIQVAAREKLGTPDFEVELLRNDRGISVMGLVPARLDRTAMVASLRKDIGTAEVTDLVESADYPPPEGWDEAFFFGLRATQLAAQAKVSIQPGKVEVRAITDGARQKADLEAALRQAKPAGVTLVLDVTAPRPVITPFTLKFTKDDAGARFEACAADVEPSRQRILAAGTRAGVKGQANCTLALGAPTGRWADAAVPAIDAVAAMGSGSVTISDTDVSLFAPESVAPAAFDDAVAGLETALPALFNLRSEHEKKQEVSHGPAEFAATLKGRKVGLQGRIADERMRDAVETLARSRFGEVDNTLRIDAAMPPGWTVRTIAAVEALATLHDGEVRVTPDLIRLSGVSGSQTASDLAAARLSQRLGAGARYELSIRYDARLDPLVSAPSGVECVDELNAAMNESEIGFEPGKSVIAGDPEMTLSRIADTMQQCGDFRIELGGHTDSQGRDEMNAKLSQDRAQAVLDAIRAHGVPAPYMTAKGYGETRPIADNEDEAGREANRRIEFTLLSEDPAVEPEVAPPEKVTGITDSAEVAAAKAAHAAALAASGAIGIVLQAPATAGDGDQALLAAATGPASAVANSAVALQVIEALTVPAVEVVFPDDRLGEDEGASPAEGDGSAIPAEDLPEIKPMGPPDIAAAVEKEVSE